MAAIQPLGRQAIELAINRIRATSGAPAVELIWTSHNRWPEPLRAIEMNQNRPLHISVLDSSFNPPTLAHFALATAEGPTQSTSREEAEGFDAHLLLLSVRNADKSLKSTDATFPQRVEMMILMAQEMVRRNQLDLKNEPRPSLGNVAVGVIDEPTVAGKSVKILQHLNTLNRKNKVDSTPDLISSPHAFRLSFLVGYDTLVRIFSPRFYASIDHMKQVLHQFLTPVTDGGDGSLLISARKGQGLGVFKGSSPEDEKRFVESDIVKPYVSSHAIRFIDISETDKMISSSQVRAGIAGHADGAADWQKLCLLPIANFLQKESLYIT